MVVSEMIKVECGDCGKKYGIESKYITDKNTKIKCLKCQNDVIIGQHLVKPPEPVAVLPDWVDEVDDISMPTAPITGASLAVEELSLSMSEVHMDQLAADLLGGDDEEGEALVESHAASGDEENLNLDLSDWDIAEENEASNGTVSTADQLFDTLDDEDLEVSLPEAPDDDLPGLSISSGENSQAVSTEITFDREPTDVDLPDWAVGQETVKPETFDSLEFPEDLPEDSNGHDDLADALTEFDSESEPVSGLPDWLGDAEDLTAEEPDFYSDWADEEETEPDWVSEVEPETESMPASAQAEKAESAEDDEEIDLEALIADLEATPDSLPEWASVVTAVETDTPEPRLEEAAEPLPISAVEISTATGENVGLNSKFVYMVLIPFVLVSALSTWFIVNKTNAFQTFAIDQSTGAVKAVGERLISPVVEATARQARQYLLDHPDLSGEDLNDDRNFRNIMVQDIGYTGSTFVFQTDVVDGKWWMRANKNQDIVGKDLETYREILKTDFNQFWQLVTAVKKGKPARGYIVWPDASGALKEAYMVCRPISGTPYAAGALIFASELSFSVNKIEQAARKSINTFRITIALTIFGGFLVVVLLSYFYTRHIVRRVRLGR